MKIVLELKEGILICRIFGKINKNSVDKLWENFEETAKGASVLIVLDQVSEIDGAGFVALYEISKLVKKMVFYCSLTNEKLQKTLRLAGFSETYQLFETEAEVLAKL